MITLTYTKVINDNRITGSWKAIEAREIDDDTYIRTYLEIRTDKEYYLAASMFRGISNPLTQLRNRGIKIAE
jgi:hypothetical protein